MRNEDEYYKRAEERANTALVPAQTETYSPVAHRDIMSSIRSKSTDNGLRILKHRISSNILGTRIIGFVTLEEKSSRGIKSEHGLKMMLGYRNSYDKSMSVGFVAGASVWICSNGLLSGDMISFRRKHTGTVAAELQEKIQTGLSRMRDDFARLNVEVDVMKNFSLTPRQKAEILGVMYFEKNMITPTQMNIIKRELTESEHFKDNDAWCLYNNITESLKRSSPISIIQDHINVHGFFKEITGMVKEVEEKKEVMGGLEAVESLTTEKENDRPEAI
jgi:hypothetical protein